MVTEAGLYTERLALKLRIKQEVFKALEFPGILLIIDDIGIAWNFPITTSF